MASTTPPARCPALRAPIPPAKSMKVLPSTSVRSAPSARATAMGVTWASPFGVCSSASLMSSRLRGPGTSVLSTTDGGIAHPFVWPEDALAHDPGHDVLHDRVVLQGVHGHVLAVAGLLEAAVRHLADDRQVVVDPHGAEAQAARGVQRAVHVRRPDGGGEAVVYGVRPADRP